MKRLAVLLSLLCATTCTAQQAIQVRPGPQANAAQEEVVQAFIKKNSDQCCDAIIEAAKQAVERGDISKAEYRRMRMFRMLFPRRFHALAEAALEVYVEEAPVIGDPAQEIDWDALLEFIRELMPIILEFIKALMDIFEPVSIEMPEAPNLIAYTPPYVEEYWLYRRAA